MTNQNQSSLVEILTNNEQTILAHWMHEQQAALTSRQDLISESELTKQSAEFLTKLTVACRAGNLSDITTPAWQPVLDFLEQISLERARKGFTPSETATFVFSIKQAIFAGLLQAIGNSPATLTDEIWFATVLLDKLGLYSAEMFLKSREAIIKRQQMEMLELSTPVIKLWDGILAVPLIGTTDRHP